MERHLARHCASDIWGEKRLGRTREAMGWIRSRQASMVACCIFFGGFLSTDYWIVGVWIICDWHDLRLIAVVQYDRKFDDRRFDDWKFSNSHMIV